MSTPDLDSPLLPAWLDSERFAAARAEIGGWTESGKVPAVSVCLSRRDGEGVRFACGRVSDESNAARVDPGTTFLVASLTKPLTALAVVMLLERGRITLDDPIVDHLPEFGRLGKDKVLIRHILTHTSGLPDMLPSNEELRARHATLDEFYTEVCRTPLLFTPGTEVRYQSMGFVVAAELVRRLDGRPLSRFLKDEVFDKLGMQQTRLGISLDELTNHAWLKIHPNAARTDWNWNTAYWLGFGAPWGGLVTTAADYARFLRAIARGGELDGVRILSQSATRAMVSNQLRGIEGLWGDWARRRPWGLGWRLAWPDRSCFFGDLAGERMFGHWGSTGTVGWVDWDRDVVVVALTTLPQDPDGPYLTRASNLLAACVVD